MHSDRSFCFAAGACYSGFDPFQHPTLEMTAIIKMWIAQLSCFDMDRSQLSMMHNKRKHSDSKHQFLRTSISQTTGNSFLCRV